MPYKDPEKQREARKKYEEKRKNEKGPRHKVWTGIFYPESAPPEPEWKARMSDLHMKIWVSPEHDKDVWTEADEKKDKRHKAGTPKKNHRHYIAEYEVQVDKETFVNDFAFLKGARYVKAVKSLRSMVRYLAHLDDPEKAQYDKEGILVFGGAAVDVVEQLGTHERHVALKEMRKYIRENNIVDFCEFVDYCDDHEEGWANLLDDNSSYVIEKYIKSRYYLLEKARRESVQVNCYRVDEQTGEVME